MIEIPSINANSFSWPVRVYYNDTDAGGLVYHANYLIFLERARTEWLRKLGYEQDDLRYNERILFAVYELSIEYRTPARFNDQLIVYSNLTRIGGASIDFFQFILRKNQAKELPCCQGLVRVACIDAQSLHPRRLPHSLSTSLAAFLENK